MKRADFNRIFVKAWLTWSELQRQQLVSPAGATPPTTAWAGTGWSRTTARRRTGRRRYGSLGSARSSRRCSARTREVVAKRQPSPALTLASVFAAHTTQRAALTDASQAGTSAEAQAQAETSRPPHHPPPHSRRPRHRRTTRRARPPPLAAPKMAPTKHSACGGKRDGARGFAGAHSGSAGSAGGNGRACIRGAARGHEGGREHEPHL